MAASVTRHAPQSGSGPVSIIPGSGVTPTAVGEFELLRRIGSGAMGEVWLARHRVTGGVSAVKLLRSEVAARERAQRFFARERRAIARLVHPHIVALHGLGDGYIATAYIDGSDLSRRMHTPIEPLAAIRYALQIASALEHAHGCGVIHRDVKPSNILVDRRGNAYLADFGLAALSDDDASQERAGTPAFMAPEQLQGMAGPAADQFALARTLATVLAGVSVSGEEDPFPLLPPSLPAALVAVLRRATLPDPAARYPSVADFALALGAVDLGDAEAPMPLAPEIRVRGPFAWACEARSVRAVTPEISCADYRLSDVARAGLVPASVQSAFRESTGHEELAWSVYAHQGRLGPVASDGALARATDLVVILHGFLSSRQQWHDAAVAICRDNAQAIVLVPDLFGSGDSRYVSEESIAALHATLAGTMGTVLRWLEMLSVRDLPTVLVGHSVSGAAVIGASEEVLGERVSRVAITPALGTALTPASVAWTKLASAISGISALRRTFAAIMRKTSDFTILDDEAAAQLSREFLRAPTWLLVQLAREVARSRPAPAETLRRCFVLLSEDDAFYRADLLEPQLAAHGIPRELMHRFVACGHYPHLDNRNRPEAKAQNLEVIVRCVDTMLTASREGVPLSTLMASTLLGDSGVNPRVAAAE